MSDVPITLGTGAADVLAGARWEAVQSGRRSDVWRCTFADGRQTLAVKAVASDGTPTAAARDEAAGHLRDEAAILAWAAEPLADVGFAIPTVVAAPAADDPNPTLVTTWIDGEADLRFLGSATLAAESFGRALAALHRTSRGIDLAACPADASLAAHLARVDERVAAGLVDGSRFEDVFARYTPGELAERLRKLADAAAVPEPEDRVLVHGDLCVSNLLVDPNGARPSASWTGRSPGWATATWTWRLPHARWRATSAASAFRPSLRPMAASTRTRSASSSTPWRKS